MELLTTLLEIVLHLDKHVSALLATYHLWFYGILFFVIFAETGFVVTPFLPGDSLLFAVGALTAARPIVRGASAPRAGGLTFTQTIVSSSRDKRMKEARDMVSTVRMQGGNVRMDYAQGKGPMGQKDAYILITAEPSQFAIVNTKEKQVTVMDASMFGSGMGAMMNNPMMKIITTNAKWSYKDLGTGDVIQGYKTRHVRIFSGSDVEIKIMGTSNKTSSSDSSDQWIAQGIDADESAMSAWSKSFASGMKSTNPEMAAEFAKYEKQIGRSGMALKSSTWSTVTDSKGKVVADTISMEVTDIKKGAIDAAIFKMPDGYQVVNLSESMKAASNSMDSAKKAEADKSKDKDKAKPVNPADAIKAGIGGMFGKKKVDTLPNR